jgi:glycosyltransferase involved in cell wall biosynthesis
MKVTIGIPFYNAEKYINSAIASVLNQRFTDFELILSDDGSTDSSLKIARSFEDPRIKVLSDDQNRGIAFRLNEQIDLASGKYFVRMDADDIMHPERISIQYEFLINNPKVDVVGSSAVIIDDTNQIIGYRDSLVHNNINKVFRHVCFIHPTVAGKTEWFRKFRYSESLKGVEDFDLWIRSFQDSSFSTIDKPLLFYRDPHKVKISTYRFRQKQLRLALKINKRIIIHKPLFLLRLIIESYFKEIIMVLFNKINLDSFIVSKRNKIPSDDMRDNLQEKLNEIVNKCYIT